MHRAADGPGLMHTFAAGLRFDTELHFQVRQPFGRTRWRKLPTPQTSSECSGWVALMQAEAILTAKAPSPHALHKAIRTSRPALATGDLLLRMSELAPGLSARWHPEQTLLQAEEPRCSPALACLAGPQGLSWALVTGMELKIGEGDVRPRALLLLDPRMPAPWATGYNARLMLGQDRWRGLDGEVQSVGLLGLIELRRKDH